MASGKIGELFNSSITQKGKYCIKMEMIIIFYVKLFLIREPLFKGKYN